MTAVRWTSRSRPQRRGAYVVLTEQGRAHFEEVASQHTELVRELFLSRFSTDELTTMASFWKRLEDGPSE